MKIWLLKRLPLVMSGCAILLAAALLLVFGPMGTPKPVAAQTFPGLPNDGRINVVAHFGGDAIYCVGPTGLPTYNFSDFLQGGFRVLSANGNQDWFVPASVINAKIAEAQSNGGQGVLVGQGQATYGPAILYVFVDSSGTVKFTYTGTDEWGKTNMLEWSLCLPVGPIPSPGTHSGGSSDCSASKIASAIEKSFENNPQDSIEPLYDNCAQSICPNVGSDEEFAFCICEATNGESDFCKG